MEAIDLSKSDNVVIIDDGLISGTVKKNTIQWRYPFVEKDSREMYWTELGRNSVCKIQRYNVGEFGKKVRKMKGASDPSSFRLVTIIKPKMEIAIAETAEDIILAFQIMREFMSSILDETATYETFYQKLSENIPTLISLSTPQPPKEDLSVINKPIDQGPVFTENIEKWSYCQIVLDAGEWIDNSFSLKAKENYPFFMEFNCNFNGNIYGRHNLLCNGNNLNNAFLCSEVIESNITYTYKGIMRGGRINMKCEFGDGSVGNFSGTYQKDENTASIYHMKLQFVILNSGHLGKQIFSHSIFRKSYVCAIGTFSISKKYMTRDNYIEDSQVNGLNIDYRIAWQCLINTRFILFEDLKSLMLISKHLNGMMMDKEFVRMDKVTFSEMEAKLKSLNEFYVDQSVPYKNLLILKGKFYYLHYICDGIGKKVYIEKGLWYILRNFVEGETKLLLSSFDEINRPLKRNVTVVNGFSYFPPHFRAITEERFNEILIHQISDNNKKESKKKKEKIKEKSIETAIVGAFILCSPLIISVGAVYLIVCVAADTLNQ